jgi:hypothetical protein
MMAMDIFYARNMSVWLDLGIILKTIPVLIWEALEFRADSRRRSHPKSIRQAVPMIESLNGEVKKI